MTHNWYKKKILHKCNYNSCPQSSCHSNKLIRKFSMPLICFPVCGDSRLCQTFITVGENFTKPQTHDWWCIDIISNKSHTVLSYSATSCRHICSRCISNSFSSLLFFGLKNHLIITSSLWSTATHFLLILTWILSQSCQHYWMFIKNLWNS